MGVAVQEQTSARRGVMGHALMFIAGFTLVFVALGATAGLLFGTFFQTGFIDWIVILVLDKTGCE
jgi:cytochrome c biogenesis protein CcdA